METNIKSVELPMVYAELLLMKKMLVSIKEDFEDRFLTTEEEIELEKAREEYKNGKGVSFEDLKKRMNV